MRSFFNSGKKGSDLAKLAGTGLSCVKQDRILFEDLNISLNSGQLVYLQGPNGAGKTSLLRILAGLAEPTSGDVLYEGEPLKSNRSSFNSDLIFLGHKSGLSGALTAMENLNFWCHQHQVRVESERLFSVLSALGLAGLEEIAIRLLSAGQQRRVALARLWLKPATFWILDEPFTALDSEGVTLLEKTFKLHVAQKGAVLVTSHQPLSSTSGSFRSFKLEYRI